MAPKRATRSTPGTENLTTTTVTNAQLQEMIDQGVTAALVARDANRNADDSHTSGTGVRRNEHAARECTYPDFLKCKPLNFKGTEGVVRLTQWFEKMESVFSISNCTVACQVKFATCTLRVGQGREICSVALPRHIMAVDAPKPKTMQDAIEFATELMDKKISTLAERQAKNKRKLNNNNQTQQQLSKRQNVAQAYAAGTGERKEYAGTLPLCNKDCWSSTATNNQRTLTCYECGNQGHYKCDCSELKNGNQARGSTSKAEVRFANGGSKTLIGWTFQGVETVETPPPVAYKLKRFARAEQVLQYVSCIQFEEVLSDDPLVRSVEGLMWNENSMFSRNL
ncbi:putative reverse transcriptase domain-containing protein [Tanacetum coccineum]|uniref:Reverse transcriptase domain-containing protein n=1 Tax=Tanacetum coccineum TaxID=301880 RepID=A0ABQ5D0H3_9ASTR